MREIGREPNPTFNGAANFAGKSGGRLKSRICVSLTFISETLHFNGRKLDT